VPDVTNFGDDAQLPDWAEAVPFSLVALNMHSLSITIAAIYFLRVVRVDKMTITTLRSGPGLVDHPPIPGSSPAGDSSSRFWFELPRTDQVELARLGSVCAFPRETVIMNEGSPTTDVMVLLSGCVKVASTGVDGRPTVLGIRDAGDIVGEVCGLAERRRSASVHALQDVEALVIPLGWFNAFIRSHIDAAIALQCTLCARLVDSDRARRAAMTETVEQRLAAALLDLAGRYGEPCASGSQLIELPLSHYDLAGLATTSWRTVGRVLMRFRSTGAVVTGRRKILIKDPAKLSGIAGRTEFASRETHDSID
jgi:CRP-like cAMP-binding protein